MIRPQTAHTQRRSNITKRAVNLTFRQDTHLDAMKQVLNNYKDIIKEAQWRFNFEEYKKKNIKKIFAIAEISLIKGLTLHFCKCSLIVKHIEEISFPRLTLLDLSGNNITSLEGLHTCNMPLVQYLSLRQNNITSVRSLRKCNFKPKTIELSQNQIIDFHDIWGFLDLSNLEKLYISLNCVVFDWGIVKSSINFNKIQLSFRKDSGQYQLKFSLQQTTTIIFSFLSYQPMKLIIKVIIFTVEYYNFKDNILIINQACFLFNLLECLFLISSLVFLMGFSFGRLSGIRDPSPSYFYSLQWLINLFLIDMIWPFVRSAFAWFFDFPFTIFLYIKWPKKNSFSALSIKQFLLFRWTMKTLLLLYGIPLAFPCQSKICIKLYSLFLTFLGSWTMNTSKIFSPRLLTGSFSNTQSPFQNLKKSALYNQQPFNSKTTLFYRLSLVAFLSKNGPAIDVDAAQKLYQISGK